MPWQNNGDGNKQNPWGSGGGKGGGGEPPNIDDIIRKSQEQLKDVLPGGKRGFGLILLAILAFWIGSGYYSVKPDEEAVVLRFGKFAYTTTPGPHLHLPYPIESVEIKSVTTENTVEIGSITQTSRRGDRQSIARLGESLMLTGDENIVDIKFNVVWRIDNLNNYLFKLSDPDGTVKAVSESIMRELVGKNSITPIITTARGRLESEALLQIQDTLDEYEAGIRILRVQIIESEAPEQVKDSFLDVQRAEADQQKSINQADAYKNKVIPEARGNAEKLVQEAQAYAAITVAGAEGKAARFLSVYEQYKIAKDVTKKRIYLETMEEIFEGMDKVIIDSKGGSGVVPYLPLNELKRNRNQGSN